MTDTQRCEPPNLVVEGCTVHNTVTHANVATTQRYAHLLPGRMERAIEGAVSGLLGPATTDERKKA